MGKITEAMQLTDLTVTNSFSAPSGSVTNSQYSTATTDRLAASKQVHQKSISWTTATIATAVNTTERFMHMAEGAGTIISYSVRCASAPTGGDLNFDLDLKVGTDAGTPASVLNSALNISSSQADDTKYAASINTTAYTADSVFVLDIATAGSTGTQAQGAIVTLVIEENPS